MASKEPDDDDEWCEKQNVEPCSIPGKTNLRSLPKRMNTWPKKNLMTMTSEVKMPLRLRPDQKALVLHPWCWELRLMSAVSEMDETSALWLLRLMAALIGFYSVKSWLRHMTLEMHSKCIRLRRFILHSEYGKMPAHDFLIGRNQPTVRPSQVKHPGHTVG